jgi:hypothetical protein
MGLDEQGCGRVLFHECDYCTISNLTVEASVRGGCTLSLEGTVFLHQGFFGQLKTQCDEPKG